MGNRASPRPPEPPHDPPKWQQVVAPRAAKKEPAAVPESGVVAEVPADRIHDEREEAPLFARLPEHAKEDLRDRWRAAEGSRTDQVARRKDTALRWVVEGALLLGLAEGLMHIPTRLGVLLAVGIGAATGAFGAIAKPGAVRYGAVFMVVYMAFGLILSDHAFVYYLMTAPLLLGLAGALAATHRVQRFDASEL